MSFKTERKSFFPPDTISQWYFLEVGEDFGANVILGVPECNATVVWGNRRVLVKDLQRDEHDVYG